MVLLYLMLLFTVLPMAEFALLWWLAGNLGLGKTVLLVLGTGVLGAMLARQQGLATLWRIRQQMESGQMPTDALLDGALILVAGAVLVTPGVVTDAMGFGLLIPWARALVKRGLTKWAASHAKIRTSRFVRNDWPAQHGDSVIDAQASETRVEEL